MKLPTIALLSVMLCPTATASEPSWFPELAARADGADPAALRDVLTQADQTTPGDPLEELALLASRYVTRSPTVFLEAQSGRTGCFGVGFLGVNFVDDEDARARERADRREALQSVTNPDLARAKARCLGSLPSR